MGNNNNNNNDLNYSTQSVNNTQNISGIPKNLKLTSWILFFISIIFSVLLI